VRVEVGNSVLADRVELSGLGVGVFDSLMGSGAVVGGGGGETEGLGLILGGRSRLDLLA
jgi:hypothetical protein